MDLNEREEIIKIFEKYKELLTQSQKQTIHLYLIEDLSLGEISKILATTRQAVHDSIKKGINKLKIVNEKINK